MSSRRVARQKSESSEASLLEQIRLLTIENETLRKYIAESRVGATNEPQPGPSDAEDGDAEKKTRKPRRRSSNTAKNRSPSDPAPLTPQRSKGGAGKNKTLKVPSTPLTPHAGHKGCSCKGTCSTRACGCVKRNVPCGESCKCGDALCQNNEQDKENKGDPNKKPSPGAREPEKRRLYSQKDDVFEEADERPESEPEQAMVAVQRKNRKPRKNRIISDESDEVPEEAEPSEDQRKTSERSEASDRSELTVSPTTSNTSGNRSPKTDNSSKPEIKVPYSPVREDFDPMRPRKQLSRSPLPGRVSDQPLQRSPLAGRISDLPLPVPVKEEPEEELPPPPAELQKDVVEDWDEHLAILVKCSKCNRTFHPHRIKKHEVSCIKI